MQAIHLKLEQQVVEMRSKVDIISEIADVKVRIDKYRDDLNYIEEAIRYLSEKRESLSILVDRTNNYDMTQNDAWSGRLEKKAEDFRYEISIAVSFAQNETKEAINDLIQIAIKVKELEKESMNIITSLEAELEEEFLL